jgi:hypothetical protein
MNLDTARTEGPMTRRAGTGRGRRRGKRALIGLELFTGVAGVIGGLLGLAHPRSPARRTGGRRLPGDGPVAVAGRMAFP